MSKQQLNIATAIEEARLELTAAINTITSRYGLPSCLMDGLLASAMAELRKNELAELSLAYQRQQQEREKELVEQFEKESSAEEKKV